jgi:hypothetical protein
MHDSVSLKAPLSPLSARRAHVAVPILFVLTVRYTHRHTAGACLLGHLDWFVAELLLFEAKKKKERKKERKKKQRAISPEGPEARYRTRRSGR